MPLPDYRTLTMPTFPGVERYSVSFGAGLDSSAMLALMHASGFRPDIIVFADPGHEWPETYAYFHYFAGKLAQWGFPKPDVIKRQDVINTTYPESLGQECVRLSTVPNRNTGKLGAGLPSVAFGLHRCSMKFKGETINAWLKQHPLVRTELAAGRRIAKCIGYESTETKRSCHSTFADKAEDEMAVPCYPLMHWKLDRATCVAIMTDLGLKVPPKSACVFCPNNQEAEWRKLATTNPIGWELALRMETLAMPHVSKPKSVGLFRRNKAGARQLVEWARREGLPVPHDLDSVTAARRVLAQATLATQQFWAERMGLFAQA